MTRAEPPRLAVALLRRWLPDNEPLAGDLLETFDGSPSRLWFWREVLMAVAFRAFRPPDRERPLGLARPAGFEPDVRVFENRHARGINLTAIPLHDVGGLGLIALAVLVTLVRPTIWWMFVPVLVGGMGLGWTMALVRRRALLDEDPGEAAERATLFRANGAQRIQPCGTPRRHPRRGNGDHD